MSGRAVERSCRSINDHRRVELSLIAVPRPSATSPVGSKACAPGHIMMFVTCVQRWHDWGESSSEAPEEPQKGSVYLPVEPLQVLPQQSFP